MRASVYLTNFVLVVLVFLAWCNAAKADEMDCYNAGADEAMRMHEAGQIDERILVQLWTGVAYFCGESAMTINAGIVHAFTGIDPGTISHNTPTYYDATKTRYRRVYALARAAKGGEVAPE